MQRAVEGEENEGENRRMGEGGNKKSTGRRGRSSGHRAQGAGEKAQSSGHRAQRKKHRAQSAERRAQSTEQKTKGLSDEETARLHNLGDNPGQNRFFDCLPLKYKPM